MSAQQELNSFLMDIFNRITKIEEQALATGLESEVSVTEIHILEKIGDKPSSRMSDVAKAIGVTLATLTVACDKLEAKGLIVRNRDKKDKRVVKVSLTPKGIVAYRFHQQFHENMVNSVLEGLTAEEQDVLSSGLRKLKGFFVSGPEKQIKSPEEKK